MRRRGASLKSFRPGDEKPENREPPDDPGNPTVDFHGEKRSNETLASTTDPGARLARKGNGKEAKLCYSAHALMENRNGLLVDLRVDHATGTAERESGLAMLADNVAVVGATVAGDKGYNHRAFVDGCRELGVTPHVAEKVKSSAIDARTTRHADYRVSMVIRKRIEEIFGWSKTIGGFRQTRSAESPGRSRPAASSRPRPTCSVSRTCRQRSRRPRGAGALAVYPDRSGYTVGGTPRSTWVLQHPAN